MLNAFLLVVNDRFASLSEENNLKQIDYSLWSLSYAVLVLFLVKKENLLVIIVVKWVITSSLGISNKP